MDNNKGQTIFLSVIGIATLLVAIVGATFAWFSVSVQGNDKASSIIVSTATLGNVIFTDGNEIKLENIRPENNSKATKTFTIANTTEGATETIAYKITLEVTTNTLSPVSKIGETDYFVQSLSGTSTNNGTVATAITEASVPTTTTDLGSGVLKGTDTHTYTYTIQFKEAGADQNSAQGKAFQGKLSVTNTDNTGN